MQCIGFRRGKLPLERCRAGAERGFRTCPLHRDYEHNEQLILRYDDTGSLDELPPYRPTPKFEALMAELESNIKRFRKQR